MKFTYYLWLLFMKQNVSISKFKIKQNYNAQQRPAWWPPIGWSKLWSYFFPVRGPRVPGYVKLLARDLNLQCHFTIGENLSCCEDIWNKVAKLQHWNSSLSALKFRGNDPKIWKQHFHVHTSTQHMENFSVIAAHKSRQASQNTQSFWPIFVSRYLLAAVSHFLAYEILVGFSLWTSDILS